MEHDRKLLQQFNANLPLAQASTAPASWYRDSEFFQHESRAVLKSSWQMVASASIFSEPGSFHSGEFLGEPFFIVKNENGELKAFYNVCRHHAAGLCAGDGKAKLFICPYHGWTYSLNGELIKTPGLGKVECFEKTEMGLVPIPLRIFGPFVFLNFSKNPSPFPSGWSDLFSRLEATQYENLRFKHRRVYEIKCNWKVFVDNYLDGGYHVKILHKGLASQLDLERYKIENFDRWTLQSCEGSTSSRIGAGALYAWLYPNFMINRYGDIMDTNWVVPLGPDRCLTVFDYYFADSCEEKFIAASMQASEQVQLEDIAISESVQKGLSSSAYHAGRYSVDLESGMHLFHRWLHEDMSRG